jgi:hypothetical protein
MFTIVFDGKWTVRGPRSEEFVETFIDAVDIAVGQSVATGGDITISGDFNTTARASVELAVGGDDDDEVGVYLCPSCGRFPCDCTP